MRYSITQELPVPKKGGRGAGSSDEQTYAEKLILSDDFIEALMSLKVASVKDGKITGGNIILGFNDIPDYFTADVDGIMPGVNGACHMLNKVFVAGKMPYKAVGYDNGHSVKTTKTKKFGDNVGDEYTSTAYDSIRVFKVSEKFSINHYAVIGSNSLKGTTYHQPADDMVTRVSKVMTEKALKF